MLTAPVSLSNADALIIADVQNDFLPGGSLAVAHAEEIIVPLNRVIELFDAGALPIILSRDWHPAHHCSFKDQGGPWPSHCIAGSYGARFSSLLRVPAGAQIISKATHPEKEAYSAFEETDLQKLLEARNCRRIFIGGLTTEYCILNTVKDARKLGYPIYVFTDAIKAVNVRPGDGEAALREMKRLGAILTATPMISSLQHAGKPRDQGQGPADG